MNTPENLDGGVQDAFKMIMNTFVSIEVRYG